MKPIEFTGVNCTFAKDQPPYLPLPVHRSNIYSGAVTSCWQLTWWERLKVLWTGKIWLQQLAFGRPLQPQRPSVDRPILEEAA